MGVGRAQRPANWVFCCQERYRQLGRRRWPSPPVSTCDHPHRNRRQPRPTGSDSGRAPRLSPPLATSGADFRSRLPSSSSPSSSSPVFLFFSWMVAGALLIRCPRTPPISLRHLFPSPQKPKRCGKIFKTFPQRFVLEGVRTWPSPRRAPSGKVSR